MLILGVSSYFHDAAAAILLDGQLVAAAEEERFTRIKHDPSFPINAINYCLEAAATLAEEGIDVEVIDLRTLRPLDTDTVLESVRKTSKAMIVHEDTKAGGIGGEIAAVIAEEAFEDLDAPVKRVAGPEVPAMPFSPLLEAEFMPSAEKIAVAMRELASY